MASKRKRDIEKTNENNESPKPKRMCVFKSDFTSKWPFIIRTNLEDWARCTSCNSEFTIGHQGKGDIERHISTMKHQKNAAAVKSNSFMSSFFKKESQQNTLDDAVTNAEVLFTHFLVEHNIHLSASDHAGQLFKAMFLNSNHKAEDIIKRYSCARTKTTCIVNKLAESNRSTLIRDMQSGPYSLATDASNDKNEKLFPIVVRLEKEHCVRTELLAILELKDKGTGENIANLIKGCLDKCNIPKENCVALTTDNANVMVGANSGLYGQLLQDLPNLFSTGCICHRIHLAAEWAAKNIPRNIGHFFIDIYYYMEKSANRMSTFKDFQQECGTPTTAVPKHCPTRWLSLATTCDWVLEQWEPLTRFFKGECDADVATAKDINSTGLHTCRKKNVLDNLKSKTVKLYVTYLSYILPVFNAANLTFQKEESQIHKQRRLLSRLIKDLMTMYLKPACLSHKEISDVDFRSDHNMVNFKDLMVGENCRTILETLNSSKRQEFYTAVGKFLKTATGYLIKNLPINDPLSMHAEVADVSKRATASFSSLQFFIKKCPAFLPSGSTLDSLEKQFRLYQSTDIPVNQEKLSTTELWQKFAQRLDDLGEKLFPDLPKVMLRILSIPHSNASCERIFSLVRKNRTDFRASMSVDTLQNLITVKQAGGTCHQQKPDRALLRACKGATAEMLAASKKC